MTPFAALCRLAGLSVREAGEFLRIRPDTAQSYGSGKRSPGPGHIAEMQALIAQERRIAARLLLGWRAARAAGEADAIEIAVPALDADARRIGLPTVGAFEAAAAMAVARMAGAPAVRFVPAGSTAATALAADIQDAGGPRKQSSKGV